ncbi:MAG: hypothetical protein ACRD18_16630 [Terriglobia bacterium]
MTKNIFGLGRGKQQNCPNWLNSPAQRAATPQVASTDLGCNLGRLAASSATYKAASHIFLTLARACEKIRAEK